MVIDNSFYMSLALSEAWKYQGLTYPNPAVGCVILSDSGEILAVEAHHRAGEAHAEVKALQVAYSKLTNDNEIFNLQSSKDIHEYLLSNHKNVFKNFILYTTLEPCSHMGKTPSCATLISKLSISKIYVGSIDTNKSASNGNKILTNAGCKVNTQILEKECEELLYPFKKFLDDRFIFFKWAQRLNATTDDGIISSIESRKNVHAMRDVCDLLVIGGNTVRIDRPTLDARLVNGKAPDVLIISREKEFDKSIPLFGVPGRKVYIEDNFLKLKNYKNIMIEGSSKMYELTRDFVDYYLCYMAPSFGGSNGFENMKDNFKILNTTQESEDIIMWMKRIDTNE
jgi:diaminohydroxyphosphoribosylaminopyrimidine deaminase/5-amino-6-(5-phosphoribosylamino)uracil reductase